MPSQPVQLYQGELHLTSTEENKKTKTKENMRTEEKGATYSWVAKTIHELGGCVENNMVLQRHSHCQVTLQTITTTITLCPLTVHSHSSARLGLGRATTH